MTPFHLDILHPGGAFFQGDCISVTVPTQEGQYGVLAHHSNVITAVVPGELKCTTPDGVRHRAAVSTGLMKVEDGQVLLLVDSVEWSEDIDTNRARRAAEAAREELLQKQSLREHRIAEANLARAMNRLRVSGRRH